MGARAAPPSSVELLTGALVDAVRRPTQVVDQVRGGLNDALNVGLRAAESAGTVLSTVARTAARPAPESPLNAEVGSARRWVMVVDRPRRLPGRAQAAGPGRLRRGRDDQRRRARHDRGRLSQLAARRGARPSARHSVVRAMVPVSIYGDDPAGMYANQVMACVVNLPVGEPGASMRLHQIAFAMRQQMEGGQAVGATSLANLAGFAPPTLHALGARLGSAMSRRLYNVMITNVPGPQTPLYAGEAEMFSTYPVTPLAKGQALVHRHHVLQRRGLLRPQRRSRRDARRRRARPLDRRVARRAEEWTGVLMPVIRVYVPIGRARSRRARREGRPRR